MRNYQKSGLAFSFIGIFAGLISMGATDIVWIGMLGVLILFISIIALILVFAVKEKHARALGNTLIVLGALFNWLLLIPGIQARRYTEQLERHSIKGEYLSSSESHSQNTTHSEESQQGQGQGMRTGIKVAIFIVGAIIALMIIGAAYNSITTSTVKKVPPAYYFKQGCKADTWDSEGHPVVYLCPSQLSFDIANEQYERYLESQNPGSDYEVKG